MPPRVLPMDVLYKVFDGRYLFTPRGEWNALYVVSAGDVFTYQGATYRAMVDSPGEAPVEGDNWVCIARQGATGIPGGGGFDASQFSSLAAAVADASTAGKLIKITTHVSCDDLTIPVDRAVEVVPGGMITVNSGHTLIVAGPFSAGLYQVFAGSGFVLGLSSSRPEWFGVSTNPTTMTAAANKAILASSIIVFSAKTYELNTLNLRSGITLKGEGVQTILHQNTGFLIAGNSGGPSTFISDVMIEGLQFLGNVVNLGFSEFLHLVAVSGVKKLTIRDSFFIGFQGDGLYLGSDGGERHNHDVSVYNCTFDGITNENRNGISVIDGDGIDILCNYFANCTRSNMPGAIDLEPNSSYNVLRNFRIEQNYFRNIKGSQGVISLIFQSVMVTEFFNFQINCNIVNDCPETDLFALKSYKSGFSYSNKITITGNSANNIGNVVNAGGNTLRGIDFCHNQVSNYHGNIAFQFSLYDTGYYYDINVSHNHFIGALDGIGADGIKFTGGENITVDHNIISNTVGYAISFFSGIYTKNLKVTFNTIEGTPTLGISNTATAPNADTNILYGNITNGRPVNFPAERGDGKPITLTLSSVGLTQSPAASAVITAKIKREGNMVHVYGKIVPGASTASIKLTTYLTSIPYAIDMGAAVIVTSNAVDNIGLGSVVGDRLYLPTWTTNTNIIYFQTTYMTTASL
jgi:hypothetical protein